VKKILFVFLLPMFLVFQPSQANAGAATCPYCQQAVWSGQCFYCIINGSSPNCTCSVSGTCPQAAVQCGNCQGTDPDTGKRFCSDVCPGCTPVGGGGGGPHCGNHPCSPTKGSSIGSSTVPKPVIGSWTASLSTNKEIEAQSPAMTTALRALHALPPQNKACAFMTGFVHDPDSGEIQKLYIVTNSSSITTVTILSTVRDKETILTVHSAKKSWSLSKEKASVMVEGEPVAPRERIFGNY